MVTNLYKYVYKVYKGNDFVSLKSCNLYKSHRFWRRSYYFEPDCILSVYGTLRGSVMENKDDCCHPSPLTRVGTDTVRMQTVVRLMVTNLYKYLVYKSMIRPTFLWRVVSNINHIGSGDHTCRCKKRWSEEWNTLQTRFLWETIKNVKSFEQKSCWQINKIIKPNEKIPQLKLLS